MPIPLPTCPKCGQLLYPTATYASHKDGKITKMHVHYEHHAFNHSYEVRLEYEIDGEETNTS